MKQLLMSVFLLIPVMLTADFDLKEGDGSNTHIIYFGAT